MSHSSCRYIVVPVVRRVTYEEQSKRRATRGIRVPAGGIRGVGVWVCDVFEIAGAVICRPAAALCQQQSTLCRNSGNGARSAFLSGTSIAN